MMPEPDEQMPDSEVCEPPESDTSVWVDGHRVPAYWDAVRGCYVVNAEDAKALGFFGAECTIPDPNRALAESERKRAKLERVFDMAETLCGRAGVIKSALLAKNLTGSHQRMLDLEAAVEAVYPKSEKEEEQC